MALAFLGLAVATLVDAASAGSSTASIRAAARRPGST
jgi:hypothetical protein